jgi:hypothetical protein
MPINSSSYDTLFIDEATLKKYSLINENVDMQLLTPTILAVQELEIMKVLGTSLYSDLQNKIANVDSQTLNEDELFLLVYFIRRVLIWGIMKKVGYYTTFRYFNKGVQTLSSDTSQPVTKDVLDVLADDANNNFNLYVDKLIRHLRANKAAFPSYNVVENQDDVAPLRHAWTSGISLDPSPRNTLNGDVINRGRYEW